MAMRAIKDHSRALHTELTTIIIGIVKKKSSSIVQMRKRFSRVIRLNLTSGVLNLTQNLWCKLSMPERILAYIKRAKRGLITILRQRSPPCLMSECCPMYSTQINMCQTGCIIMKIQHAFEAELDVNSAPAAHAMYERYSRLPRMIPVHRKTYPGVHFISDLCCILRNLKCECVCFVLSLLAFVKLI